MPRRKPRWCEYYNSDDSDDDQDYSNEEGWNVGAGRGKDGGFMIEDGPGSWGGTGSSTTNVDGGCWSGSAGSSKNADVGTGWGTGESSKIADGGG